VVVVVVVVREAREGRAQCSTVDKRGTSQGHSVMHAWQVLKQAETAMGLLAWQSADATL
jgi:hypothetical protein